MFIHYVVCYVYSVFCPFFCHVDTKRSKWPSVDLGSVHPEIFQYNVESFARSAFAELSSGLEGEVFGIFDDTLGASFSLLTTLNAVLAESEPPLSSVTVSLKTSIVS